MASRCIKAAHRRIIPRVHLSGIKAYNKACTALSAFRLSMGIRFNCPNGHKLNVKEHLAGKRGVCPQCGAKFVIPELAELAARETAQTVGSGIPQSVDAVESSPLSQSAVAARPVPSSANSVADVALQPHELSPSAARQLTNNTAVNQLPASIAAIPTHVEIPPESAALFSRGRSRRNQLLVSLLLLGLVVILAGILVWVLKRSINEQSPLEKKAAAIRPHANQMHRVVAVNISNFKNLRVGAQKI